MTTAELIRVLQSVDPDGSKEVGLIEGPLAHVIQFSDDDDLLVLATLEEAKEFAEGNTPPPPAGHAC